MNERAERALEAAAQEIAESTHVLPWNVARQRRSVLAILRRHGLRAPGTASIERAPEPVVEWDY